MSYVIYDIDTTIIQAGVGASRPRYARDCGNDQYETERAAKAAMTREKRIRPNRDLSRLAIAEKGYFNQNIEKTRVVYSIMDQKHEHPIVESVNTPGYCSPSCESYWSM